MRLGQSHVSAEPRRSPPTAALRIVVVFVAFLTRGIATVEARTNKPNITGDMGSVHGHTLKRRLPRTALHRERNPRHVAATFLRRVEFFRVVVEFLRRRGGYRCRVLRRPPVALGFVMRSCVHACFVQREDPALFCCCFVYVEKRVLIVRRTRFFAL